MHKKGQEYNSVSIH